MLFHLIKKKIVKRKRDRVFKLSLITSDRIIQQQWVTTEESLGLLKAIQ